MAINKLISDLSPLKYLYPHLQIISVLCKNGMPHTKFLSLT